jgi:small subunit ribosomal protein S12
MPTINQIVRGARVPRVRRLRKPLGGKPQLAGRVISVVKKTPKKPNSAQRTVVKVLLSNGKTHFAYVPGEKSTVKAHDNVLIRMKPRNDLIGIMLEVIRGAKDCQGVPNRKTSRSRYGTKKNV